jgi:hypothetical protein
MKTRLRPLVGSLTVAALAAGTLVTSAGIASAATGWSAAPIGTLKTVADKECATPYGGSDGTPTRYYTYADGEISDGGEVVARWAYMTADTPNVSFGTYCFVAEAVEPDQLAGSKDASFSVTLSASSSFEVSSANKQGSGLTRRSSGNAGVVSNWDHVDGRSDFATIEGADKPTAQVGAHISYLHRGPVALTFNIGGKTLKTETINVDKDITVPRTSTEVAAAAQVRDAADAAAHKAHTQLSKKVGQQKSAARAKVRHHKGWSKARKAKKMAAIDKAARAKRARISASCQATRAANRAVYAAAIAPVAGTVTVPETRTVAGDPFNQVLTGTANFSAL